MDNHIKYFFFGSLMSIFVSVLAIAAYHYWLAPTLTEIYTQKAYGVAESDIQFSDRFTKAYRSSTPTDFVLAAQISRKAVVFIKATVEHSLGDMDPTKSASSGSGVVISNDGYIITNHHVIANASKVEIMLNDNREFVAKLIGSDPSSDLALLKIEAQNLDYLIFGNSDSLLVGEWVMAVGNPFKLQSTVTAGIVSAKARNINLLEKQGIESFIQTDAAVNPGNSGGALINTRGDLIGICTAILSNSGRYEGFSFAIPSNLTKKVIADIKEYGAVQRGWLGIEMENIDNEMAGRLGLNEVSGVFVSSVFKDGSAYQAGLRNEDVIISVNNVKTSNIPEFMEQVAIYRPGDILDLVYIRNKQKFTLKATLKNQLNSTDFVAVSENPMLLQLGVELRDLDRYEKAIIGVDGIMVVSIKNGSVIGNTRMEPGYVITKINNKVVTTLNAFIKTLEMSKGKTVILEGLYKNYPGEYPYTFEMLK